MVLCTANRIWSKKKVILRKYTETFTQVCRIIPSEKAHLQYINVHCLSHIKLNPVNTVRAQRIKAKNK